MTVVLRGRPRTDPPLRVMAQLHGITPWYRGTVGDGVADPGEVGVEGVVVQHGPGRWAGGGRHRHRGCQDQAQCADQAPHSSYAHIVLRVQGAPTVGRRCDDPPDRSLLSVYFRSGHGANRDSASTMDPRVT